MQYVSPAQLAVLSASSTQVSRRVDVYESDATTIFMADIPIVSGGVTADETRDERRDMDITFDNRDRSLDSSEGGFWYDKVIKPNRGVVMPDDTLVTWQLGEFMIDEIDTQNFPHQARVTGRDYTKKCLLSKFAAAVDIAIGTGVETLIGDLAINAGIDPNKMILPVTGMQLGRDFIWDADVTRWKAMNDVAVAFGYELFFDAHGYLVMRVPRDPTIDASSFTFLVGPEGNVSTWKKITKDVSLFNHFVVTNDTANAIPIVAEAINNDPGSSSRVGKIGDRMAPRYSSTLITTVAQAQTVADQMLRTAALEEWEAQLTNLTMPFMECGDIMTWDETAMGGLVSRWRMSNFALTLDIQQPQASDLRRVSVSS